MSYYFNNALLLDIGNKREMGYTLVTTREINITDLLEVIDILNNRYNYGASLYTNKSCVASGIHFKTDVGHKEVMLMTFLEIPEKKIRTYVKFIPTNMDNFVCIDNEKIYTMFITYRYAPEFTEEEKTNIENAFKEIGVINTVQNC